MVCAESQLSIRRRGCVVKAVAVKMCAVANIEIKLQTFSQMFGQKDEFLSEE